MSNSILANEPFSEREAWRWLIKESATYGKVHLSIRNIASKWDWHKSKVERFIRKLKHNELIETNIEAGILSLKISNVSHNKDNTLYTKTEIKTIQYNLPVKYTIRDKTEAERIKQIPKQEDINDACFETVFETQEEEKKKRTKRKKEKEKFQKEKNTPFRELKKEKVFTKNSASGTFQRNHQFSHESIIIPKTKISFSQVNIAHIGAWAMKNQIDQYVNLEWELGKFKDYWNSTYKKPPKDAVAAFRNWLRKTYEYQITNKRGNNERFISQKINRDSSLNNFLLGAAELAAKYEKH